MSDPVFPQDGPTFKDEGGPAPLRLSATYYYYEWDNTSKHWQKLVDSDPDPDESFPIGQYDGQVYQVKA